VAGFYFEVLIYFYRRIVIPESPIDSMEMGECIRLIRDLPIRTWRGGGLHVSG